MSNIFIHDTAVVDKNVKIGDGTKVWHFSHIQENANIGSYCVLGQNINVGNNVNIGNNVKIQNNVSIYEGVTLEDYVFCGPSCIFTNILIPRSEFAQRGSKYYTPTLVKKSASIGANATIVCGNTIGEYSMVGSGAVVTKDVKPFSLVFGNPARFVYWIDKKGKKLLFDKNGISKCKNYALKNDKVEYLSK